MNPKAAPTFSQLFREHLREYGSLLAADGVKMLLVFVAPSIVLVGLRIESVLGRPNPWLDRSETVDSIVLFLMILILSFDSVGKLLALTIRGWQTWVKSASKTSC
jgi:hypothetical protein